MRIARLWLCARLVDRQVQAGNLGAALARTQRGIALIETAPHRERSRPAVKEWRASLLNTSGYLRHRLGDLAGAERDLAESLRLERELDPSSWECAQRLSNLAVVVFGRGDPATAQARYLEAISLTEAIDPQSARLADDLSSLGVVYARSGRIGDAEACYERARRICEVHHVGTSTHAAVLNNWATVLLNRGELDQSLGIFQRVLEIEQGIRADSVDVATALSNIGLVHDALGDRRRALVRFEQALAIDLRVAPESPQTAVDHNNIGMAQLALGKFDEAIHHFMEALRIDYFAAPKSAGTAGALFNVAYANHLAGNIDEAIADYQKALSIEAELARSTRDVAMVLTNLGAAEFQAGNGDDAVTLLSKAEAMLQELFLPADLVGCRTNLATVLYGVGQRDEAIACAERACEAAELSRVVSGAPTTREQVFALHQSPYGCLIEWLRHRDGPNDHVRAFELAEASRARGLADLLVERQVRDHPHTPQQAALVEQEQRLQADLGSAQARLAAAVRAGDSAAQRSANSALDELLDRLDRNRLDLRAAFPAYAELEAPRTVSMADVQAGLDSKTMVITYATGLDGLFVWAVRGDRWRMRRVGIADDVFRLVSEAIAEYRVGSAGGDRELRVQHELSSLLLGVVPDECWQEVRRLIVIPTGELFYLPFELLPWRSQLLNDTVTVSYTPSMSVLRHSTTGATGLPAKDFVGYAAASGRTPIPAAASEVRRIGSLFPANRTTIRTNVSRAMVNATIGQHRFVHFATHAIVDDERPLHSGLLCGTDDYLRGYEILSTPMNAELVVCSACETGLGTIRSGEGLIGLSRAFFLAGAQCLVVTLWPVPDRPTARLMTTFYDRLVKGTEPATALQDAKNAVRASHPQLYTSPWTWAAFIIIGASVTVEP